MIALADATGYPLMGLPFTTSIVMVLEARRCRRHDQPGFWAGMWPGGAIAIACTMLLGFERLGGSPRHRNIDPRDASPRHLHPPAGITPMIVMTTKAGPLFLLVPVARPAP
jgi:hypothetical protein